MTSPKQLREERLKKLADYAQELPKLSQGEFDQTLENYCRAIWHMTPRTAGEYVETAKMMIGYIAPNVPESGQTKLPE